MIFKCYSHHPCTQGSQRKAPVLAGWWPDAAAGETFCHTCPGTEYSERFWPCECRFYPSTEDTFTGMHALYGMSMCSWNFNKLTSDPFVSSTQSGNCFVLIWYCFSPWHDCMCCRTSTVAGKKLWLRPRVSPIRSAGVSCCGYRNHNLVEMLRQRPASGNHAYMWCL